jgi:16S rRNA G1207 methylase RsmC
VEQTRKLIEQEGVLLIFSTFGTVTNVAGGIFNRAMTEMSRGGAEAIIQAYDFSAFQHVVDVGGGQGLMLAAILAAHSKMRGTLFDQPKVVAGAKTVLQSFGVADRCDFIGGSFFESVPEGRDAYIMRAVVHDW